MIPLELRQCSRWMAWFNPRDAKIPFDAKRGCAAPHYFDDPSTWSSFEQVRKRIPKPGPKRGWGLLIDSPFIVVDVDGCFQEGGLLTRRGSSITASLLRTYCELSPSRKGLHLWYRCAEHSRLPAQAIGAFEVYSRRRFMTVTGDAPNDFPVRELSYFEALDVFRLANPQALEDAPKISNEEGYWSPQALEACLAAWRSVIPIFKYEDRAGRWAVPCPNYHLHSEKRGELSRDAQCWVQNGWPVFHCFHAHCAGMTWRGFADFFDPFRQTFDFDSWQEEQLRRLDEGA